VIDTLAFLLIRSASAFHSGRTSFTGALTNGALWRFFVAHPGADRWQIYSSAELATDTDQGLVIELLKDMVSSENVWVKARHSWADMTDPIPELSSIFGLPRAARRRTCDSHLGVSRTST
jgi:hypothetical protein